MKVFKYKDEWYRVWLTKECSDESETAIDIPDSIATPYFAAHAQSNCALSKLDTWLESQK